MPHRLEAKQPEQIVHKIPSPKYQNKMDWNCGSSGKVLSLQVRRPKFKTPVLPKKKV
jgi:hypothetical protein